MGCVDDDVFVGAADVGKGDASVVSEVGLEGVRDLLAGLPRFAGVACKPFLVYADMDCGGWELSLFPRFAGVLQPEAVVVFYWSIFWFVAFDRLGYGQFQLRYEAGGAGFQVVIDDVVNLVVCGDHVSDEWETLVGGGYRGDPDEGGFVATMACPFLCSVGEAHVSIGGAWVGLLERHADVD